MENRTIRLYEEWVRWNPTNLPDGEYAIIEVVDNDDGTRIVLDNTENFVEILFDGLLSMSRIVRSPLRMRTWGEVQDKYSKDFFVGWFLYKVENSLLSKWLEEENCGFEKATEYTHYCIVSSEAFVDIISTFEPQITSRKMTDEERRLWGVD